MLIMVFVLSFISWVILSISTKNQYLQTIQNNFEKTISSFSLITATIEKDLTNLSFSDNLYPAMHKKNIHSESNLDAQMKDAVNELGYCVANQSKLYQSIYTYSNINDYIISWTEYSPRTEFYDTDWLETYMYYKGTWVRTPPMSNNKRSISIVNELSHYSSLPGLIIFNLDYEYLESILDLNGNSNSHILSFVVYENGQIIYSTDSSMLNCSIDEFPLYRDLLKSEDTTFPQDFTTARNYYTKHNFNSGKYSLVCIYPQSPHYADSSLLWVLIFGIILGFFVSLALSILVSRRFYQYILDLMSTFRISTYINDTSPDFSEMHYIRNRILRLIARNETIEIEFANKLSELTKSQMIALQTQMDSHFLMNTLQLINYSIIEENGADTRATHIVTLLADILRSNFVTSSYLTRFGNEILQAQKYMEIQNIRSDNKYIISWDLDKKAFNLHTVKFILQPILENSIKHGFPQNRQIPCHIWVSARVSTDTLCYEIRDNGIGFPPEKLDALQERLLSHVLQEDMHVGLLNVNMRISIICGPPYGVSIHSVPDQGTTVRIIMPIIQY